MMNDKKPYSKVDDVALELSHLWAKAYALTQSNWWIICTPI